MDLEQKDLRKWYAVQTRSNMEQKAVDALKRTIDIEDMGEYINKDDILMPTELVSEVKNNKKTTRKRKLYPGYIFVKVKLYDEDENFLEKPWYMIRAVNGVINFMGGDRPTPLKKAEIDRIFQQMSQGENSEKPKVNFEVGEEVYEAFRMNGFAMDYISEWKPETHKHHIDLWAANRMQLLDFGVPGEQIETSGICTYMRHEEFFSARRLGIKSGRILSGIMIVDTKP